MAVDSATISTASGILKEAYEPGVISQIAGSGPLWAELDKSSEDIVQGKYAVLNLRLNPSQAISALAELGTLPAAQRTRNVETQIKLAFLYGVMRITGPLMEASRTDKGAFIRALRNEVEGMTEGLKRDVSRQVYGDGTGNMATCGVTTASLTVVLDPATNMQYFEVGMLIDLLTASTAVNITNGLAREVISIDPIAKTILLDTGGGTVTTDATTAIYRKGVGVVPSSTAPLELIGLSAVVGTGTLYTIDPTVAGNERWQSRVNATFGSFDLQAFQAEVDAAEDNSGEWITHIYSNGTVRNIYLAQLTASRRFITQEPPKKLNAGFTGLAYTGGGEEAVWVKDKFAPAKTIFGLRMKDKRIQLRRQKDFEFITIKGEAWLPDIYGSSGVDAFKAVMAMYGQIVANKRNCHFKLGGVVA